MRPLRWPDCINAITRSPAALRFASRANIDEMVKLRQGLAADLKLQGSMPLAMHDIASGCCALYVAQGQGQILEGGSWQVWIDSGLTY